MTQRQNTNGKNKPSHLKRKVKSSNFSNQALNSNLQSSHHPRTQPSTLADSLNKLSLGVFPQQTPTFTAFHRTAFHMHKSLLPSHASDNASTSPKTRSRARFDLFCSLGKLSLIFSKVEPRWVSKPSNPRVCRSRLNTQTFRTRRFLHFSKTRRFRLGKCKMNQRNVVFLQSTVTT